MPALEAAAPAAGSLPDAAMVPPAPPRLPGLCAICRRWTRGRVCLDCVQRFAPAVARCVQCGLRTPGLQARCGACLRRAHAPVARTVAAVDYGFPWDGLIAGFKFHQRLDLADALARLLAAALAGARAAEAGPALVVPVPLSAQRLRERGYNQAWELARRLARWSRIEARPDVLLRLKDTAHQLGLSEAERAANLRGAFLVEPRQRPRVQGRVVALVDDVATSGATADEAARVLKAAGAAQVHLWVVARTP
jgi:ComF family protein